MVKEVDHIGIAVENLDSIIKTLKDALGLHPNFQENISDQKVRVAGFNIGKSVIEYIEPTAVDSPISKFLEKRGNGIHHIALRVINLNDTLETLRNKGYLLIDDIPKIGSQGKKIAFIHPASFNGILIELCEY